MARKIDEKVYEEEEEIIKEPVIDTDIKKSNIIKNLFGNIVFNTIIISLIVIVVFLLILLFILSN